MSDLSRLLDDVYNSTTPAPAPSWSSDTALEEAFADWAPGPPADAPEEGSIFDEAPTADRSIVDQFEEVDPVVEYHLEEPDADDELETLLEQALQLAPFDDGHVADQQEERTEPEAHTASEPSTLAEAFELFDADEALDMLRAFDTEPYELVETEELIDGSADLEDLHDLSDVEELEELDELEAFVVPTLVEPEVVEAPEVPSRPWCRADDDILPSGRRRRLAFSRR
jgi:hypothetical protein